MPSSKVSVKLLLAAACAACAACAAGVLAGRAGADDAGTKPPAPAGGKPSADAPKPADANAATGGIQWFAVWEQGLAEAKRTGRPILLIAAAPQCHSVSGLW